MYCVCIYYICVSAESAFVRTTTKHFNYITRPVTLHRTSCVFCTRHVWKSLVLQRQHVDTVGCGTFFFNSWLIGMFVFDILQIPGGCIQICSGCTAPNCTPWLRACLHNRPTDCLRTDSLLVTIRTKFHMPVFPSVIDLLSLWNRKLSLCFMQPQFRSLFRK
jgi:hypothetical protein